MTADWRLEQWTFFLRNAELFIAREIARILPAPVFQEAIGAGRGLMKHSVTKNRPQENA